MGEDQARRGECEDLCRGDVGLSACYCRDVWEGALGGAAEGEGGAVIVFVLIWDCLERGVDAARGEASVGIAWNDFQQNLEIL